MLQEIFTKHPYWSMAVVACVVNVPLGYMRENCQKFSIKWLFWIHASIPLIVYMRIALGTSRLFIPVSIALAVVGQVVGSRWRRQRLSFSDSERTKFVTNREESLHVD